MVVYIIPYLSNSAYYVSYKFKDTHGDIKYILLKEDYPETYEYAQ